MRAAVTAFHAAVRMVMETVVVLPRVMPMRMMGAVMALTGMLPVAAGPVVQGFEDQRPLRR